MVLRLHGDNIHSKTIRALIVRQAVTAADAWHSVLECQSESLPKGKESMGPRILNVIVRRVI